MNKKQYELKQAERDRLESQYTASLVLTILLGVLLVYLLFHNWLLFWFWLIALTLIGFLSKSTPYQIRQKIKDVEYELVGYEDKKGE